MQALAGADGQAQQAASGPSSVHQAEDGSGQPSQPGLSSLLQHRASLLRFVVRPQRRLHEKTADPDWAYAVMASKADGLTRSQDQWQRMGKKNVVVTVRRCAPCVRVQTARCIASLRR